VPFEITPDEATTAVAGIVALGSLVGKRSLTPDYLARRKVVHSLKKNSGPIAGALEPLDKIDLPNRLYISAFFGAQCAAIGGPAIGWGLWGPTPQNILFLPLLIGFYFAAIFGGPYARRKCRGIVSAPGPLESNWLRRFEAYAQLNHYLFLTWLSAEAGAALALFRGAQGSGAVAYYSSTTVVISIFYLGFFLFLLVSAYDTGTRRVQENLIFRSLADKRTELWIRVFTTEEGNGQPAAEGKAVGLSDFLTLRTAEGWTTDFRWWQISRVEFRIRPTALDGIQAA
jgi:hypothetical protein